MKFREDFILKATLTLKAMSEDTRLKILLLLMEEPMNNGKISKILSMSPSAISHQLRILKSMNLIISRRKGKNLIYSIKDDHVKYIIEILQDHVKEIDNA